MSAPARSPFQYALLRVVPDVARGECINAGVVLFCRQRGFLGARVDLDARRLAAIAPGLEPDGVRDQLDALALVAAGDPDGGPLAALDRSERFHWLAAPASTVVQPSPVHTGLCEDPEETLEHLFATLVAAPRAALTARREPGSPPRPWLIVPTYNEARNVEALLRGAHAQLASVAPEFRVLVVDDASPDGTGRLADALAAELPEVEVVHRAGKRGLASAYLAGFERALAGGADLVLEMDADFSHDPADLPRLIAEAAHADLVLGSRYVRGGGIRNWGVGRRILSRGGSLYARLVLGVPVRDLTGGFKCFRREVLDVLALEGIEAEGYSFQVELTYRALLAGFHVREIPIVFHERRAGDSKMSLAIALEAVWRVPALRWGRTARERRRRRQRTSSPQRAVASRE